MIIPQFYSSASPPIHVQQLNQMLVIQAVMRIVIVYIFADPPVFPILSQQHQVVLYPDHEAVGRHSCNESISKIHADGVNAGQTTRLRADF